MSNIVRWNPMRELAAMQSAMDRLFNDSLRSWTGMDEGLAGTMSLPIDVHETDNAYIVTTELPGVSPENINVRLQDNVLMIDGELPEQKIQKEGQRTLMQERRYGKFSRYVRLPQQVDPNKVEAQYENGILTLTVTKSEAAQPRQIPVKSGGNSSKK